MDDRNDRHTPEPGRPEQPGDRPDTYGRARRRLMMTLAAGGGAFAAANVLPKEWTRPIINSVIVPAHAQGSPSAIVGTFFTAPLSGSIFDFFVQPLHAAVAWGVVVGNASFTASWDVVEEGYAICGNGEVLLANLSFAAFTIDGTGGRSGNSLNGYKQSIPEGTLAIFNQEVSDSLITFSTSFQTAEVDGSAGPGAGCDTSTTSLRLSSPYPDDEPV